MLPVHPALHELLPEGLRRGSTVSVTGSMSLLLALLAPASAAGAWCVLVDLPAGRRQERISAEAARDHGIDLARLPIVPVAGAQWTNVVGALLDAFDIVAVRPPERLADGDLRRLAARARSRSSVLVPFLSAPSGERGSSGNRWPMAEHRLVAEPEAWSGVGEGAGRLVRRRVRVVAEGRGQAGRSRTVTLWLPDRTGGVDLCPHEVVDLASRRDTG
jgi:hypothetical protein